MNLKQNIINSPQVNMAIPKPILASKQIQKPQHTFIEPKAVQWVMLTTLYLIKKIAFKGVPILRRFKWLTRLLPFIKGLQFTHIDFPEADYKRAKNANSKANIAIYAPNHLEFFTDYLVDWAVMSSISKKMAFWSAEDIVFGPLKALWLKHNLIATTKDGKGKAYSAKTLLNGHGVLIHPEGDIAYTGNTLQNTYPGVASIATTVLKQTQKQYIHKQMWIVPIVYRYRNTQNASAELHFQMHQIEKRFQIHNPEKKELGKRFFFLMKAVLQQQAQKHSILLQPIEDNNYFQMQTLFIAGLLKQLEEILNVSPLQNTENTEKCSIRFRHIQHILRQQKTKTMLQKTAHPKQLKIIIQEKIIEIKRAMRFSKTSYGQEMLSHEQLAESLMRVKQDLFKGHFLDPIKAYIPMPITQRCIHVRSCQPIQLSENALKDLGEKKYISLLMRTYREKMQQGLNSLLQELEDKYQKHQVLNSFK